MHAGLNHPSHKETNMLARISILALAAAFLLMTGCVYHEYHDRDRDHRGEERHQSKGHHKSDRRRHEEQNQQYDKHRRSDREERYNQYR
jgi:hypothetical protein